MIWLIIMIGIGLVVLGLTVAMMLFYRKHKMPPTDYYTFFIVGISIFPIGLMGFAIKNPGFYGMFIMGLCFMGIGLANKDKWDKNHRTWNQLSKEEQKMKMVVMVVLGILVVLGLLAFLFTRMMA